MKGTGALPGPSETMTNEGPRDRLTEGGDNDDRDLAQMVAAIPGARTGNSIRLHLLWPCHLASSSPRRCSVRLRLHSRLALASGPANQKTQRQAHHCNLQNAKDDRAKEAPIELTQFLKPILVEVASCMSADGA
jgi:hypothetical protein